MANTHRAPAAFLARRQPLQPNPTLIHQAIDALAHGGGIEARGAIFTRPEVVDFILDLAGYTPTKPLHTQRILEPAFGGGRFLAPHRGSLAASVASHPQHWGGPAGTRDSHPGG